MTPTTQGQPVAGKVNSIPCPSVPFLKYRAPTTKELADSFIAKTLADPMNVYDTPETVTEILKTNAAINAVCGLTFLK